MKTYFAPKKCPHEDCGKPMDATEMLCPFCGREVEDKKTWPFQHQTTLHFGKQLALFFSGWLGLTVLGLIVGSVFGLAIKAKGATEIGPIDEMIMEAIIYLILLAILLTLCGVFRILKPLFLSFKNWKAVLFGLAGFAAMITIEITYNFIVQLLFKACGIVPPGDNANQSAIVKMTLATPVPAILIFGLVGPFCEEITYRVGLFGFASRLGKFLGYAITALVFGLIHFNFGAFGDGTKLIIELTNLPNYIGAGLLLCFLYDRFGFAAATTAHTINNLYSVLMILATATRQ